MSRAKREQKRMMGMLRTAAAAILYSAALLAGGCAGQGGSRGGQTPPQEEENSAIAAEEDRIILSVGQQQAGNGRLWAEITQAEGVVTVWKFDAPRETEITVDCRLDVRSGKAGLVLVSPDGSVEDIYEVEGRPEPSGEYYQVTLSLQAGTNRIRLTAKEGTSLELDLLIGEGEFSPLASSE